MEHRREQYVGVRRALGRGPDDTRENLLTVGTSPGPIPATDFSRDDCRPDRMFGTPIRGVDRRIK